MIFATISAVLKSTRGLLLALGCIIGCISTAYATSGSSVGQVGVAETIGSAGGAPGNFDFRVYLLGGPVICNGQIWAYVNSTEANYNAIVANILSARASGASVTLNWNQDGSGYCHISYMSW
jgi:hypothetical protein